MSAELRLRRFELEGLDCPTCARQLCQGVAALPGVSRAEVDFPGRALELEYDERRVTPRDVRRRVTLFGCTIVGIDDQEAGATRLLEELLGDRHGLATLGGGVFLLAAFTAHLLAASPTIVLILGALAVAVAGARALRAGVASLILSRRADMHTLMSVAAVGALIVGQPLEGGTAMVLFALGRFLETFSAGRTRRAIAALLELTPPVALRLDAGGQEREVPAGELVPGDRIVVPPASRVPVDGVIREGQAQVDESALTGESLPVTRGVGDEVLGGTLSGESRLTVEVLRPLAGSVVSRMVTSMEQAASSRAPSERWIDAFAAVYTPIVMVLAALVAFGPPLVGAGELGDWVMRGLVVLVTACPCALVISTPVAVAAAIGAGSRHGVLFKSGAAVESLGIVRSMAFDKTGTLTQGQVEVVAVEPAAGHDRKEVLALAAGLEQDSAHPIARALLLAAAREDVTPLQVTDFATLGGRGVMGFHAGHRYYLGSPTFVAAHVDAVTLEAEAGRLEGAPLLLAGDDGLQARFVLRDQVRLDACGVLTELHRLDVTPLVMLSGDREEIAREVGRDVGVDEVRAPLLPDEKVAAVGELQDRHGVVAMVGDGINDIPSLAAADVGIVMGVAGSDVALDAGDVALMADDLGRLPYALALGRGTRRVIAQNVMASLAAKLAVLPLGILGLAPLWLAVAADMGTSLLVTLNSMRLFRVRPGNRPGCDHPHHAVVHEH